MSIVELLNLDLAGPVSKAAQPQVLNVPKLPFRAKFNADLNVVQIVLSNPLLQQQMFEGAQKSCQETISHLVALLKQHDRTALRNLEQGRDFASSQQTFYRRAREILSRGGHKADMAAGKTWKDLVNAQKDYSSYKGQMVKTTAKHVAKTGLATGALVGTVASGGAASPLGIAAIVKSCIGLGRQIRELSMNAESMGKLVSGDLRTLIKSYKTSSGVKKRELGKKLLLAAFGIELASLETVDRHNLMYGGKLKGLYSKSHELAGSLYLLMDKAGMEAALVKQVPSGYFSRGFQSKGAWIRSRLQKVKKLEGNVDKAIKKTIDLHLRSKIGVQVHELYADKIATLVSLKSAQAFKNEKKVDYATRAGTVGGAIYTGADIGRLNGGVDIIEPTINAMESSLDALEAGFNGLAEGASALLNLLQAIPV